MCVLPGRQCVKEHLATSKQASMYLCLEIESPYHEAHFGFDTKTIPKWQQKKTTCMYVYVCLFNVTMANTPAV